MYVFLLFKHLHAGTTRVRNLGKVSLYIFKLAIKDTADTQKSASYLEFHLEIHNGGRFFFKYTTNAMTSNSQLSFHQ